MIASAMMVGSAMSSSVGHSACSIGKFRQKNGCVKCAAGTWQSRIGQSVCYVCPTGTYQPDRGEYGCYACPNAKYSNKTGATACLNCPVCSTGNYATSLADKKRTSARTCGCAPCPHGKYFSDLSWTCQACPGGYYNSKLGHSKCNKCAAGKFSTRNAPACSSCLKRRYIFTQDTNQCAQRMVDYTIAFGLFDDSSSNPPDGWQLMTPADLQAFSTLFRIDYSVLGGVPALQSWKTKSCCITVDGGLHLAGRMGSAVASLAPEWCMPSKTNESSGAAAVTEHEFKNSTNYRLFMDTLEGVKDMAIARKVFSESVRVANNQRCREDDLSPGLYMLLLRGRGSDTCVVDQKARNRICSVSRKIIPTHQKQDCKMSPWIWTKCSTTCQRGFRQGRRKIIQYGANGGKPCPKYESLRKFDFCNIGVECPTDCAVSNWTHWSACASTCDNHTRTRMIVRAASGGGAPCPNLIDQGRCYANCTGDCVMSAWRPLSKCSRTCGEGSQVFRRTIRFAPRDGGAPCPALGKHGRCFAARCSDDCMVGGFSRWSACTSSCGEAGSQYRKRRILAPALTSGKPCPALHEAKTCNIFKCPRDCQLSAWAAWSPCTATCGQGVKFRSRVILQEAQYGGKGCSDRVQNQTCFQLDKSFQVVPCRSDCKWRKIYSECSKACGIGYRTAHFEAPPSQHEQCQFAQPPANKGLEDCNILPCRADCVVSHWHATETCSKSCGSGTLRASRAITTQPIFGGKDCPPTLKTEACNTHDCPVDCLMTPFGPGNCLQSCGESFRVRTRRVVHNPSHGGHACPVRVQQLSICTQAPCVADCQVGNYSRWSSCSLVCGGGVQSRYRSVAVPPTEGGKRCPSLVERRACNLQPCVLPSLSVSHSHSRSHSFSHSHNPTNSERCVLGAWSSWSKCSKSCGAGTKVRTRKVQSPPGMTCPSAVARSQCNTHFCPINCVVSTFANVGGCSVSCGKGKQMHVRHIVQASAFGGRKCPPTSIQPLLKSIPCEQPRCPIDCSLGIWSSWSACEDSCGTYISQHRMRRVLHAAQYGGMGCASLSSVRNCELAPCPVDCVWGSYVWAECSRTCGTGYQAGTRQVQQQPKHGGRRCPGLRTSRRCAESPCANDCSLGSWGKWSKCSVTCGEGAQARSRRVISAAKAGGKKCPSTQQSRPCSPTVVHILQAPPVLVAEGRRAGIIADLDRSGTAGTLRHESNTCPADCTVSAWQNWGPCTKGCQGGKQVRARPVVQQPHHGGKDCPGLVEVRLCPNTCLQKRCSAGGTGTVAGDRERAYYGLWSQCSTNCGGGMKYRVGTRERCAHAQAGQTALRFRFTQKEPCNEQLCGSTKQVQRVVSIPNAAIHLPLPSSNSKKKRKN